MQLVTRELLKQDLPDNPVYLTLDVCIQYCEQNGGKFPSYRAIAQIMGELLGKKPLSTATVRRYLFALDDNGRIERCGAGWRLKGGKFYYYEPT